MGLLVAFLSLTNIALGYGLAIYLRRASLPTAQVQVAGSRPEIMPAAKPSVVVEKTPSPVVKELVAPSGAPATIVEAMVAQAPPPEEQPVVVGEPVVEEVAEVEPASEKVVATEEVAVVEAEDRISIVDEENVLAGIEAFRAQLAKHKDEGEPVVDEAEELAAK